MVSVLFVACTNGSDPTTTTEPNGEMTVVSDFGAGSDGWASDLSDFTIATRPDDFISETGVSPPGVEDREGDFFHLAATNTSDDAFMYLRRPVMAQEGLEPGTPYVVSFTVDFFTDAPSGCAGIGGAPGESVWMKGGAATDEPVPVNEDGDIRLSVDKGNQSQGGPAAVVLGVIANGVPCEEALEMDQPPYAAVTLTGTLENPVTTDGDGSLWVFVGTDSGFEGRTSVYYDRIVVAIAPAS